MTSIHSNIENPNKDLIYFDSQISSKGLNIDNSNQISSTNTKSKNSCIKNLRSFIKINYCQIIFVTLVLILILFNQLNNSC